jgi:hypothetical protein
MNLIKINRDYVIRPNFFGIPIEISSEKVFELVSNEKAVLELIKTPLGRYIIANAKNVNGESALHAAVVHESVALEITKKPEGLKYLADVKDNEGKSALCLAVRHESVMKKLQKECEL